MLSYRTGVHRVRDIRLGLGIRAEGSKDALHCAERGQDIIEYALVVAILALAATAAMSTIASRISTVLSKVGNELSTYTS
jgi:pilus assembly protein Flp/PilA